METDQGDIQGQVEATEGSQVGQQVRLIHTHFNHTYQPHLSTTMSQYTIVCDVYPDNTVIVNGSMAIAYGVAESISKVQGINVDIKNTEGSTVYSVTHSPK